jgi:hypothetical protein
VAGTGKTISQLAAIAPVTVYVFLANRIWPLADRS